MTYLINRTVIAATRLEFGSEVAADEIGSPAEIDRLVVLGAIEKIGDAPDPDDALRVAVIAAINDLPWDGFTSSGKPSVEALEAALPEYADRINAALRDAVWQEMGAAADAAP